MRALSLFLCVLIAAFMALPVSATECTNSGTAPGTAPDDTADGDATACGHLAVAGGNDSIALGYGAASSGEISTALGYQAVSSGEFSNALGISTESAGDYSIALGYDAESAGESSTSLGRSASSVGINSTALGYLASAASSGSIALGYLASAGSFGSVALGRSASSVGSDSTALGRSASSAGPASIALGFAASSGGGGSTALGYNASATAGGSTALGIYAFADQLYTVILGAIPGVNGGDSYAKVGMGTSNPVEAVDVERSAAAARFQLTSFTDVTSEAPQFIQRRARGTTAAPTAVQNNDNLGLFSFRGYNGTSMGGSRAAITAQAAGTFTDTSTPTRLIFSTTPVGSTAPQSVLVITPDGKVQVKGVNLNVPDYVFEDDYELMPLEELRSFIDENGHLPGIASADEVQAEGLDLAGSQMSQLQKIEELTLYALQQERRLAEQESRLAAQQEHLEAQQARIAELEALQQRVAQLESLLTRPLATID